MWEPSCDHAGERGGSASYWRFDASVFYKKDNWSAQVNFKNISDEDIYQSQGYLIYPDAPFNVQASVTFKF